MVSLKKNVLYCLKKLFVIVKNTRNYCLYKTTYFFCLKNHLFYKKKYFLSKINNKFIFYLKKKKFYFHYQKKLEL